MFCRAPPPHLPPSLWVRYLPAWGSARDVSERPACSRVPVSPHGQAVAVRGQVGFVPVLLGPRVSADFNVLPLWPLLVRSTRQPQGSSRRLCGPVGLSPRGRTWGERWAPPCRSASNPGSPPRSRISRSPLPQLLLAVGPVSQTTLSLTSPKAQLISHLLKFLPISELAPPHLG